MTSINKQSDCFLPSTFEESQEQLQKQSDSSMNNCHLSFIPAAKQLIPLDRPTKLQPRVFIKQPIAYQLSPELNQPYQETEISKCLKGNKPSLGNKQLVTISDFIIKKQLQIIYQKQNKNQMAANKTNQIEDCTGRIRNTSQVSDYNHKDYRQLVNYVPLMKETEPEGFLELLKETDVLEFDSRFETGNLCRAYQNTEPANKNYGAYFLLLEKDVNTHGYTNWFHFRVKNQLPGIHRFFILNVVKRTSLYKQGMRISIFSKNKFIKEKIGWCKAGDNIHFIETRLLRFSNTNETFNCLYFEYQFSEMDEVHFAANQPYSYSRLIQSIQNLQSEMQNSTVSKNRKMKTQILGHTLSNNIIPSIKISQKNDSKKQCIVILGRQHPSEIAGSYISEFMMKYFLNETKISEQILIDYDFIFIPMVNPDGVIYGNSRCNLSGLDLNRHWGPNLIKQLTPETHKIRQFIISTLQKEHKIRYVLDLHGHGKKLNSFFFCCQGEDRISNRIYPMIMSKINERIDLSSCTYGISKDKQCTIRAQLYELGIKYTFTLQNSFLGYKGKVEKQIIQYNQKDYEALAISLIEALFILTRKSNKAKDKILAQYGFNSNTVIQQLEKQIDRLEREEKKNIGCDDVMSDSDPEGDILQIEERLEDFKNKKIANKIKEGLKKKKKTDKRHIKKKVKSTQKSVSQDSDQSEKKLESKLVLSKRNRTQRKFKDRNLHKEKKNIQDDKRLTQKMNTQSIILSKQHINSSSIGHYQVSKKPIRNYDRARLYSRIKTEAIQVKSKMDIVDLEESKMKKEEIEQKFNTLRDESLKAMMKESFSMMGLTAKPQKCKWIQQNSSKTPIAVSRQKNTYSVCYHNQSGYNERKNYSLLLSSEKRMAVQNVNHNTRIQEYIPCKKIRSKPRSSQRKYEKFQKFLQGSCPDKNLSDNGSSVFYHFPLL